MADAAAAPAVKPLTCPSCGGTVTLRAAGYTMSVGCEYCGSILDVSNPLVKLVVERHEAAAQLEIPLGTRGTLDGIEWEVVGYLRRSEGGAYPWEEYLLFNPYHGYRWLITNGRGWSFGEMLTVTPDAASLGGLILDGERYTGFFRDGQAQVDYVLGEFYWRVTTGERVRTDDWVRPGWMLSCERNGAEISWTRSRLLTPDEIEGAFGVDAPRRPWPPLPHQPSPYRFWVGPGAAMLGVAALFLLILSIVFTGGARLASGELRIAPDGRDQEATFGPIELKRPWQKVAISAEVPTLDNGWVDLDFSLVDRKTQASFQAYKAAERYSGRDSDGAWSEGSGSADAQIASVPAGVYDLIVEYRANRWDGAPYGAADWRQTRYEQPLLKLRVDSGNVFFGNLLLGWLALLVPFAIGFARHVSFEQARQGKSDFGMQGIAKAFQGDDD